MKHYLIFILLILSNISCEFSSNEKNKDVDQTCDNSITYRNAKQTYLKDQFLDLEPIKDCPKFINGEKAWKNYLDQHLVLTELGKTQAINLNYSFIVDCEGKIYDITDHGDAKLNFTNIVDIIQSSQGMWIPAKIENKPVNCLYFGTFLVIGTNY